MHKYVNVEREPCPHCILSSVIGRQSALIEWLNAFQVYLCLLLLN